MKKTKSIFDLNYFKDRKTSQYFINFFYNFLIKNEKDLEDQQFYFFISPVPCLPVTKLNLYFKFKFFNKQFIFTLNFDINLMHEKNGFSIDNSDYKFSFYLTSLDSNNIFADLVNYSDTLHDLFCFISRNDLKDKNALNLIAFFLSECRKNKEVFKWKKRI